MKKTPNRWLILAAAVLTNLSIGIGYAWSVFQASLLEINKSNGWQLSQTAFAYSLSFVMVPFAMIFFGPKIDAHGPKKYVLLSGILFGSGMFLTGFANSIPFLYVTYGIIAGLGIGTGYGAATSVAVKWFPDKKGLAGGLAVAGFGSGPILFSPIIRSVIASVGVYDTFKILGAILLVVITLASLVMEKAPVVEQTAQTAVPTGKNYKQMLKEGKFWVFWVLFTLGCVGGVMTIGVASNMVTTYNLGDAVLIVMLLSLSNTLGRVFWGFISDRIGRYLTVVIIFLVTALGAFLLLNSLTFGALLGVAGMMCIGLSYGGLLGTFPGITVDNWGAQFAGSNYGWMFTGFGVAAISAPVIAAKIKETTGSYEMALMIVIAMAIFGAALQFYFMKKVKKS